MDYFVYILYSKTGDKYYVGYSPTPEKRLLEHNSYENKVKFTAKYQPWELKFYFFVSQDVGEAMKVECFIKKQKSRQFIEKLISCSKEDDMIKSIIKKVLT